MRYDSQQRGFMDKNGNYGIMDKNGDFNPYMFDPRKGPRDKRGNPIEVVGFHLGPRTKYTHPYSYDPMLQWKKFDTTPADAGAVYSDRLWQHDYSLFRRLCQEHFAGGNDKGGDSFANRSPAKIEAFLRAFYGNPELELVRVEEHCNPSNGYPLWVFFYRSHLPATAYIPTGAPDDTQAPLKAPVKARSKTGTRAGSKVRNRAHIKARNLVRSKAGRKARATRKK